MYCTIIIYWHIPKVNRFYAEIKYFCRKCCKKFAWTIKIHYIICVEWGEWLVGRSVESELSSKVNLCTARERPWLPLRRELDCCIKDLSNKTEGEITRGCCLH